MKIADYGKAITSYIESPTKAQKDKLKLQAGLLEEYLGDDLEYQRAVDDGFQGTKEDYYRYKSTSEEDRTFLAEGTPFDFSGLSVPQLKLLYKRYTGTDGPSDPKQLISELKRLIKGLDEDGIPFAKGGRVHLAEGTPPPKKPRQLKDLYERINRAVLAVSSRTVPPELIVPQLETLTQEYIKDGLISGEDARKFAIDRKDYWDKWISENPGGTTPTFDFDNEGSAIEVSQEEIIRRINEADGGRVKLQSGTNIMTLDPVFPTKDPTSTDFKPLDLPGAIIPPLAIGAGAKRIKDIFFSKKEDDKKDLKKSDDKNNLIKGDGPDEPDPLDDLARNYLIDEAVERLKKKEMDVEKRTDKTLLARDLDLDIPKSGLYDLRKDETFFNDRLKLLKKKGINFDGYYSTREIANLLGIKTNSGIIDFVNRKDVPMVKKGLFNVLTLNDFLNAYEPTKERIQKAPPLDLSNLARQDFLKDNKSPLFERFKRLKFEPISKKEYIPPEIRSIYDKYDLSKIEGGHPFPVEFFTKEFGEKGTLKNKRQFDWIHRNKDKLFNPNDLVLQSKDINQSGGPFYNAISELKPLYKELGKYVDKYEGKGAVKNKKDIDAISKLNLDIMKIIGNSKEEVQNFIKENPDSKLTIPKMKTGGLHGAIFDYETGEVELYAPDKQVLFESGAVGDEPQDQKLKIAEGFLDVLNQVVDDKQDLAKLLNYFEGKMLPKFQKGGPVYGKYAKQIARLS